MRLAIAGITTESCTFSPLSTALEDFTIVRGDDLRQRYGFMQDRVVLPLIHARALPGGPVTREACLSIKEEFLRMLSRGCRSVDFFLTCMGP